MPSSVTSEPLRAQETLIEPNPMSGFRLNSCRWFAAAFTLWFALLNLGIHGLHTCGANQRHPAQTDALQPVQYVHGFVADRLNGFCPPFAPCQHARHNGSATISGACFGPAGSACMACQYLSNTRSDGILPAITADSMSPADFTVPTAPCCPMIQVDYSPLSPRAPPTSL